MPPANNRGAALRARRSPARTGAVGVCVLCSKTFDASTTSMGSRALGRARDRSDLPCVLPRPSHRVRRSGAGHGFDATVTAAVEPLSSSSLVKDGVAQTKSAHRVRTGGWKGRGPPETGDDQESPTRGVHRERRCEAFVGVARGPRQIAGWKTAGLAGSLRGKGRRAPGSVERR